MKLEGFAAAGAALSGTRQPFAARLADARCAGSGPGQDDFSCMKHRWLVAYGFSMVDWVCYSDKTCSFVMFLDSMDSESSCLTTVV